VGSTHHYQLKTKTTTTRPHPTGRETESGTRREVGGQRGRVRHENRNPTELYQAKEGGAGLGPKTRSFIREVGKHATGEKGERKGEGRGLQGVGTYGKGRETRSSDCKSTLYRLKGQSCMKFEVELEKGEK